MNHFLRANMIQQHLGVIPLHHLDFAQVKASIVWRYNGLVLNNSTCTVEMCCFLSEYGLNCCWGPLRLWRWCSAISNWCDFKCLGGYRSTLLVRWGKQQEGFSLPECHHKMKRKENSDFFKPLGGILAVFNVRYLLLVKHFIQYNQGNCKKETQHYLKGVNICYKCI